MRLPIRTERLTLRALSMDDIDHHRRLFGDPQVVRYLYEDAQDHAAADEHLRRRLVAELPEEGSWLNLAVELEGRYLGEVGLCLVSRAHRQCEVGYIFLPEAAGQGYATEATAAMVELAFVELDAHRVCGRLDARNEASARLLARLGMRREAHLRENEFVKGEWTDECVFAITEDEWRSSDRA
jgi:RimJ/RimL family protein N-acetyltransferase